MKRTFLVKSPVRTVIALTVFFMLLNGFLPLDIKAEAVEYPFKLTITLEKTTFKLGELVNVTWTLTNIGEENVTLYHSRDFRGFLIRDEDFHHVYRYGGAVAMIIYPFRPIVPGESRDETRVWRQVYDDQIVKLPSNRYVLKEVPPGTYYVSGYSRFRTFDVEFETPVIRITILGG